MKTLNGIPIEPNSNIHFVFVYGTLRKGQGNNSLLSNSKFIDEVVTEENLSLFVSGLPYMIKREGGRGVIGELYAVNEETLSALDRLEGHPTFYKRERIKLRDGVDEVWAYIFQGQNSTATEYVVSYP